MTLTPLQKRILSFIILLCAMGIFLGYGLYHIGQFETTDEHFWKYDRIQKYYHGIEEGITQGQWKKTRINDKPGVTVALLAGAALPFITDPDEHRDGAREKALRKAHDGTATSAFHTDRTEAMNAALRLPILLFSTAMLAVLFWLILALTQSSLLAAIAILSIATTPALVGISQILNPDAILWSTMSAAIIAFMAHLRRGQSTLRYLWTATVFTGLALLSKYTASLLFVLFPLLILLFALYEKQPLSREHLAQWLRTALTHMAFVIGNSSFLFALLMPAVFARPEHFLYGTFLSPALASIALPFAILMALWYADAFLFDGRLTYAIALRFGAFLRTALRVVPTAPLLLLGIITLLNAWRTHPWLPLSHLKEVGRDGGALLFPQIVFDGGVLHAFFVLIAQVQNFFFALPTLLLIAFLAALALFLWRVPRAMVPELTFIPILALLFFIGGTMADIFVNVRYSIVLYPFITLFVALLSWQCINAKHSQRSTVVIATLIIAIVAQICALNSAKPFYLTYQNTLLPQEKFVADAWGYGLWEAAQFLNAQNNARDLVVWSSAGGDSLCQFFVGSCLRPQKIDLSKVVPDYIVLTRRRSIIRPLQLKDPSGRFPTVAEILQQTPVWELHMNGRPENFVKIYKMPKPQ